MLPAPLWKVIFRIGDQRGQVPSAGVDRLVAVIAVSPSPVVATQCLQSEGNVGRVRFCVDGKRGGAVGAVGWGVGY